MRPKRIVLGARVRRVKVEAARELRKHMTLSEKRMWHRLRAGRLEGYHFRRQQVILGFIVDFYCHRAGLAIEIDGVVHKKQAAYDFERDGVLEDRGVRVLRFRNDDVLRRIDHVLAEIRQACGEGEAAIKNVGDDAEEW